MSELAKGWIECKVGDLIRVKNGYAFKSTDYTKDGFPIIRISEINNGKIDLKNAVRIPKSKVNYDFQVNKGDLLMALSGATTGKVGVFHNDEVCFQNQRVGNFKIINEESLIKGFRNYFILSKRKEIELSAYGGAQPNISGSELEEMDFPLAPLNEQKRIVEKLDKLLTQVNESKRRLEKIPVIIKRFKQSVLNAAVTGELTKDWRLENRSSSQKLYDEIIQNEKRRKRSRKTSDQSISVNEINIPDEWMWCRNEHLSADEQNSICAGPFGTIFKAKDFRQEGVPIIFLRHIGEGKYLTKKPGYMDKIVWENLFQSYSVFGGELLVTKLGEPPGTCAIYPEGIGPAMVTPDVIKMNVNSNFMVKEFLMYYLNSPISRTIGFGIAYGVTRLRMNLPLFRSLPIPLPTIEEQKEIVKRVETLFKKADEIEERYKKAKVYIDKLTQSILAKAFRGELVTQDPNDEPADKLLERIRAEKEKQSTEKGKMKKVIEDLINKHHKALKKLS